MRPSKIIILCYVLLLPLVMSISCDKSNKSESANSVLVDDLQETWKTGAKYFPDNIFGEREDIDKFASEWYSSHLKALEEPSIYSLKEGKNRRMYRFLWLRSFHRPIVVRIKILEDGSGILIAKMTDGAGGYKPGKIVTSTKKKLAQKQVDTFLNLLANGNFWELASWERLIGMDGAAWIIEGLDNGNYHLVDRWSPDSGCVREVGLYLLELAGFGDEKIY